MPDKAVPISPVAMMCGEPLSIFSPLPSSHSFAFYAPDMAADWCRIQCNAGLYLDPKAALCAFDSLFAARHELLRRRMVFVHDGDGLAVGVGCLWPGDDLGWSMERVQGVAVLPEYQGQGIGKALVARLMNIWRASCRTDGVYLLAPADSRIIGICRQFGFKPYLGACPHSLEHLDDHYEEDNRLACQNTAESQTATSSPPPATKAMFFAHDAMFSKCSIYKVFELSAPNQSGDVPHSHDYYQIWYVTRGSCEHLVEGQKYKMLVGDAFLIPPRVVHSTVIRQGGSIICCEFYMEELLSDNTSSYDRLRKITQNISFTMLFQRQLYSPQPKFTFSRKGQRMVEKLMCSMLDEYNQAEAFFEDYLHLQILELLLTFAREYSQSPAHEVSEKMYDKYRNMVETAIRYIDQHYDKPLTLDEVCKISMVSKTYFCYLFKQLTQQTFIEYLANQRINRAMELLRQTDMSIIDIGQAVGFRDPTNFSRTFKRLKGISPRDYRIADKHC